MKLRQLIESFVISNDEFEDYLDRATEQLATEIQSGKNARDAVHDLSVQFSKMHNSAYAAYTRMSDSLFARLHTLELEGSESSDMMGGDMGPEMGADIDGGPEMLNDPMGSGMEMDVPPAEDMPMDSEMDDYNAVMANEPEMEEDVQEEEKNLDEGWCAICGNEPCACDGAVNEVDMGQAKSVQDRKPRPSISTKSINKKMYKAKLSSEQQDRLDDLIYDLRYLTMTHNDGDDSDNVEAAHNVIDNIRSEFGNKVADQIEKGAEEIWPNFFEIWHGYRPNSKANIGRDNLSNRKSTRITKSGKANKTDIEALKTRMKRDKGSFANVKEASNDTYAVVSYDYSDDWGSIELIKDGKTVEDWNDYFGANETGNPLAAKFVELCKKHGIDPTNIDILSGDDEDIHPIRGRKSGYFDGKTFKWNESVEEGWETMKPIDKEKYQERPGLEGPFQTRVGKVVYYDPKEGAYYDPDSDMYMSYEEWKELDGNSPLRNEAEEQFAGWLAFYNGRKLAIRKHQAKDIYNAKLKAIKHFNVPKSKQGLLAIKPAYEELNEAKQLNELLPLLAPAAVALAPHLAGAAARAVGGALVRRGATALAQRGAAALAKRGATGAARAVNTAVKGAKAASRANTANKVVGAAKTAANIIGSLGKGASSGATSGGKDYSTLAPSLSKLNNSKYDKNKK